jgi:hypothetical protein
MSLEKIKADINFNYTDRNTPSVQYLDIAHDNDIDLIDNICFNIPIDDKRPDDFVTVTVRIDDFMHALGKALTRKE